ncbi:hypothetical protein AS034_16075 [[Bacillus] enclensis]|uniref:4-aminobutyrate aminotransferase n=1 Tax=[Bacillus] enclensis TaxID=1402860 RepID=A0A0V8HD42_9BACI|nr:aspartate aminotransferase family protein [[Bacillus] enclensis]KSU60359.1 hypothetical protein AS034_16075 [[Bacillus] enclensis]SCC23610.1 4-aminobutyrate aminotransferase [[Bacillus] enclensis]
MITIKEKFDYLTRNTWPNEATSPVVKGDGIYFWDENNKKYMDFSSQTLNLLLGQCYPAIVEALTEQIKTLTYASSRFGSSAYLEAAKRIVRVAPKGFTRINIKMCDGSDANETALKTAKKFTGKPGVISFHKAHTGQTTQTLHVRGYARDERTLLGSTEDVTFISPPSCQEKGDYKHSLKEFEEVITKHGGIGAVLVDPMMVNAGVLVNEETSAYLKGIEALCHRYNVMFILDENQSFGWVPGIFAANYYDISPDIITLGKGLSSGHPLAGVLVKEKYKEALDYNEADFTHGGHVLTCRAAATTIETLETVDFHLLEKEKKIESEIRDLQSKANFPLIHRGVGLIHGLEFATEDEERNSVMANSIFETALRKGLFLRKYNNKIILKPPVIVSEEEIEKAFAILSSSFKEEGLLLN